MHFLPHQSIAFAMLALASRSVVTVPSDFGKTTVTRETAPVWPKKPRFMTYGPYGFASGRGPWNSFEDAKRDLCDMLNDDATGAGGDELEEALASVNDATWPQPPGFYEWGTTFRGEIFRIRLAPRTVMRDGVARRRVDDLRAGDRVDFQNDVYADPDGYASEGEDGNPAFAYEFAVVEALQNEWTRGNLMVIVYTDQGAFAFPADHMIDVDGEQDENHEDGEDME